MTPLITSVEKASPNKSDRGLILELVYGVLRYRETLDWRLNLVADRPMARLPVVVAMTLRLGGLSDTVSRPNSHFGGRE